MKKLMIIFILCVIVSSCKHGDKMAFVKNVLNNPDSIEVYLQNNAFSSKFFLNYYSKSKDYELKQIKRAKYYFDKYGYFILNFGEDYIDDSGILHYGIVIYSEKVAVEMQFGWWKQGDNWDFSSINIEFRDTIPK